MLSGVLTTVVPALLPALSDGIRGVIARFTGGAGMRPQNVEEYIQVQKADVERLKALAELDRPTGEISPWVSNLRASARYFCTFAVIAAALAITVFNQYLKVPVEFVALSWDLASGGFFYLFGDRVYMHIKRGH